MSSEVKFMTLNVGSDVDAEFSEVSQNYIDYF